MRSRSQVARLAAVLILAVSLHAYAQDQSSDASTPSEPTLRSNSLVTLRVVKQWFPAVTRVSSGPSANAIGRPIATRTAIYSTRDDSKKVTLSVDEYQSAAEALVAYQGAVKQSQVVPEFLPIAISNVGQNVFAGTVTRGTDTQISIGALDGSLMVSAALSGYDATTDNIANLAELARKEIAEERAHVRARR